LNVKERRQYIRKSLHSTISVFERNTNEYIGLLADYSEGGFMIASTIQSVDIGQHCEYMLLVQSPMEAGATRVSVDADCAWCEKTGLSFYGIGYQVDNISDEAQRVLESYAD